MAGSSSGLHENDDELRTETIELHRAIVSLMEELEAIDWYDQRADACSDDQLREILTHNRDDEKEHAAMLLEWIRRRDPAFDSQMRRYLFSPGPIEEPSGDADADSGEGGGSLRVGDLRGKKEI